MLRHARRTHRTREFPLGEFADATDLLVGFIGPNAYVSPSWYVSANMLPTWNYVAIEVRGRIELLYIAAASKIGTR